MNVMSPETSLPTFKPSLATWIGLVVSLFGMLLIRQLARALWSPTDVVGVTLRELGMWLVAAVILFIVLRCEKLPLRSIGLGTTRWWRSLLWSLLIAVACFVVAAVIVTLTGYNGGELGKSMDRLPLWLVTLIVTRAGVVEELCYRGYAIERLRALGLPAWLATSIPLAIFGLAHWTGGWANIVLALALGGILALIYLWRRDLVANMVGHFLVDFIGNVVPRLFS